MISPVVMLAVELSLPTIFFSISKTGAPTTNNVPSASANASEEELLVVKLTKLECFKPFLYGIVLI